ncbi:MAG: glycerophosphodiester phosphodiesterase family protein [Sphingobium sp.]
MIGWLDSIFAPAPDAARVAFLRSHGFAHRGLHSAAGSQENSLRAFAMAIAGGHGMECDVQLSRDDVPFVFHDADLDRLTSEHGPIANRTAAQLDQVMLRREVAPIPRLSALLTLVAERTPLLIELKAPSRAGVVALCRAVERDLAHYDGPVAVMSFNPQVGAWFASHAPSRVRGLVVTEENARGIRGKTRRNLAFWWARPDFLAYDIRDLPSRFARRARKRGVPVLTWTVRTPPQRLCAEAEADAPIFEIPADGAGPDG